MSDFTDLLRRNGNYRNVWMGQVVSEIGDYFNSIAVLSLVMETTGSGLAVSAVMLARAIPAVLAGPVAGVALDRYDRRRIMIASDLIRCLVALGFVFAIPHGRTWLVLLLSAALMLASPFFTSGRASILPAIASPGELHTANSLTQTTQWAAGTAGTLLAGISVARFGYAWAFVANGLSFLFSAAAIWRLRLEGGASFRARRSAAGPARPWREYTDGLRYIGSSPLTLAIALISVGWAMGGGAAQILFTLFGAQVFHRGAAGIGTMWGFAGAGLLIGGGVGHVLGRRVDFSGYKHSVSISYLVHGAAYVLFSVAGQYWAALLLMLLSRVGMAVTSVLNTSQLLRHTPDAFRGRVFATMETVRFPVMVLSMALAGLASERWSPRAIGVAAGMLGALTALGWAWANWRGHLPEPAGTGSGAEPRAPSAAASAIC
ncbi:MAG: MFS transporter [Bryobacteraceae bacterium]|jgi:MFS family permease